jgi:hypothetical protein
LGELLSVRARVLENTLTTSNSKDLEEPRSYKEILQRKDKDLYLQAMQLEIEDLSKSNNWCKEPQKQITERIHLN